MSDFIPNSFQVPNVLIDQLLSAMTPLEFCCLMLIIRKTRGWHKDIDAIALSQFKQYTGVQRDKTLMAAISGLQRRGFVRVRKRRGHINQYELTDLFRGSGEFATSGEIATGKIARGVVAKLPPTKDNTKYKEPAMQNGNQLDELGRNVGLVRQEFEADSDFRSRVVIEMSRRRFDAMQSK